MTFGCRRSIKLCFPVSQPMNMRFDTFAFVTVILLFPKKGVKRRLTGMSCIGRKYQNVYQSLFRTSPKIESLCYLGFNSRWKI